MTIVYLGGPINGCTDEEANGWREGFMEMLGPEFDYLDPMVRDDRGREDESVNEIVENDKDDIDKSDIVLAYSWQISAGTSMEVYYAWAEDKLVVMVIPEGMRISPWYRYHSTVILPTLKEAAAWIREMSPFTVGTHDPI